jgi:hypothetical protein
MEIQSRNHMRDAADVTSHHLKHESWHHLKRRQVRYIDAHTELEPEACA